MLKPRKMLGLAVSEQSITIAEVGLVRGLPKGLRTALFTLPSSDPAPPPEAVGKALRQFLRDHRFSARHAVIGLGAHRLVAKEKTLPPTSADMVAGVLAMAAEREFASDPKDLVFDFSGPVPAGDGQAALLVAAHRSQVDHLAAAAQAAGLKVAAVSSTMLALAGATHGAAAGPRLVLYLSPTAVELAAQIGGGFRLLRRLPVSAPPAPPATASAVATWLDGLAGELRRVLALLPGAGAGLEPDLLVWNAGGLPPEVVADLGRRLAHEIKPCRYPADLGMLDAAPLCAGECAAAAALALAGLGRPGPALDFLHSRLQPRRKIALGKKVAWASAVAAAMLLAAVMVFLEWRRDEQDVQDLREQLADMKDTLTAARSVVDKAAFARGWYDRRPKHLDCLRELTLAFPAEGKIWATSLAVGEDLRVLLQGKARDEGAVLEVLDRLKGNPKFSDVKPMYIREVGGGSRDVAFAINLAFVRAD